MIPDKDKASITRIYRAQIVVGAGFLISNQYVLTCAHVITQALGIREDTQEAPTDSVYLDFPFTAPGQKLEAKVIFWQPVSPTASKKGEDIAVLKLEKPPNTIQPARLIAAGNLFEHSFSIFGFPRGHDNGVSVYGEIKDGIASGWVQIEGIRETGYHVEPGFSGAPVWDKQLAGVVGIVVARDRQRPEAKAAFMIPTWLLIETWPELKQYIDNKLPFWIEQRLRKNFPTLIERSQEIQQIVGHLLDEKREPLQNIIVLWGPGGWGKTALALLTCCDSEILQHFSGGIFWVDLGEGKNVVEGMKKLYKQLTNSDYSSYDADDDIATELLEQWGDHPCLIVLDNVQTKEEIEQFYSSNNEHCVWIITTRRNDILTKHYRYIIEIQVNSYRLYESVSLLYHELSVQGGVEREKLEELVNRLYKWPLLIDLVGNEIKKNVRPDYSPSDALNFMIKRLKEKGLVIFEKEISESLRISLKFLQKNEQERFKKLVIFRESIRIPLSTLEKFWDLDESDVEYFCGKLDSLSLLKKFDRTDRYIRLYEHIHQTLKKKKESQEKLQVSHRKLLESYAIAFNVELRENIPNELLDKLSNEERTYFIRCYTYHWRKAGY